MEKSTTQDEVVDWLVETLSECEVGDEGWKKVHMKVE